MKQIEVSGNAYCDAGRAEEARRERDEAKRRRAEAETQLNHERDESDVLPAACSRELMYIHTMILIRMIRMVKQLYDFSRRSVEY
jgi:hypothetical protein